MTLYDDSEQKVKKQLSDTGQTAESRGGMVAQ